ncbi:thiolase family protein [Glaciimonas immobilis]|uniref:Acetyl-CoA acetyltransferase n=1 Tax=Glaciimonas immobilis TaxID=728004 RepID=A0A840RXA1_9BURK|nr:thiolase family protein [Glaciimonas immobilis]MBB5201171.1 acetyl-CoA acetyltransferase [Glaciimonas immobilis]
MMSLRDKSCVTGVGETAYVRGSTKSAFELQIEASLKAIADAGLTPKDIDGIIPVGLVSGTADDFIENFGIPDLRFSAVIPHGGASPVMALQCAAAAVAAGICNHVLITFGRNVSAGSNKAGARIHQMPQFHFVTEFEYPFGAIAPAQLYAPMARRHMELYGTTVEQFGEVAVACRKHALLNENALMKKPITLEDHRDSRMISDPFRLLDCSLESDGGAAVIVSAAERAGDLRQPRVYITGVASGHPDSPGSITQRPDMTSLGIGKAAARAFAMAGVTHADIDVAEIYDCFTYAVIRQIEDMGFCAKGEGGPFVSGGRLQLGGALPTNTHGGLLSQAHVWGLNHIVELVRQLRGQGGRAQVENAEVGLVTGYGDMGDGAIALMRKG